VFDALRLSLRQFGFSQYSDKLDRHFLRRRIVNSDVVFVDKLPAEMSCKSSDGIPKRGQNSVPRLATSSFVLPMMPEQGYSSHVKQT
jgi:hypothetical protein